MLKIIDNFIHCNCGATFSPLHFWNFQDKIKHCPICKKVYNAYSSRDILSASINLLKKRTDKSTYIELWGESAKEMEEYDKDLLFCLQVHYTRLFVFDCMGKSLKVGVS